MPGNSKRPRVIWDIIISEEIDDINNDIGALNWVSLSKSPGLNSRVNEKMSDDWLPSGNISHGIERGREVWAKPIMKLLKNPNPNREIIGWKRLTSSNLEGGKGKEGLIEIVNTHLENDWCFWQFSDLRYDVHNGEGIWGVSMWKESVPDSKQINSRRGHATD